MNRLQMLDRMILLPKNIAYYSFTPVNVDIFVRLYSKLNKMDFGRLIIGLFLITNTIYKLYQKRIGWSRMMFSVLVGMGFILQAISGSEDFQMEAHFSPSQMEYWSLLDQFLLVSQIFFLGRYIYELIRNKKIEKLQA